jgi:hypothetical protein
MSTLCRQIVIACSDAAAAQALLLSLIARCLAVGIPWAGVLVEAGQGVVAVDTGGGEKFVEKHA